MAPATRAQRKQAEKAEGAAGMESMQNNPEAAAAAPSRKRGRRQRDNRREERLEPAVLREFSHSQRLPRPIIAPDALLRLLMETNTDFRTNLRFHESGFLALHEVAEVYIVQLFEKLAEDAKKAGRRSVTAADIWKAMDKRDGPDDDQMDRCSSITGLQLDL